MTSGRETASAILAYIKTYWRVGVILLGVVVIWSVYMITTGTRHERALLEKNYLLQGEAIIKTLSKTAFDGWTNTRSAEELTGDYREMAARGEVTFIALTDLAGRLYASSDPEILGSASFPRPEPPEDFMAMPGARWRISEAGGQRIFWTYRLLNFARPLDNSAARRMQRPPHRTGSRPPAGSPTAPEGRTAPAPDTTEGLAAPAADATGDLAAPGGQAAGETLPRPGERNVELAEAPRQSKVLPGSSRPESTFYFWVGFDMREFDAQEAADRARIIAVTVVTGALGILVTLILIWAHESRVSEGRAREIVRRIKSGLFLTDTSGRVTLANDEALRISGLREVDILRRTLEDLTGGAIPSGSDIQTEELEVSFRGGKTALLSVFAWPYFTTGDEPDGRLVLVTDVSGMVRLRRELAEKDLLAGLGAMARHVAHEIRNPLSSIKGFTQHLLGKVEDGRIDPETFAEELKMVLVSVNRLKDTVTEVLDYGRPAEVNPRAQDMGTLLMRIKEFVAYDPDWGGAVFEVSLPPELPVVAMVDDALFSEGLLNLFLNAVQAVGSNPPERPGKVEAELCGTSAAGAVIAFRDNGPGFPADQLEKPFKPYYTTKAKGSGLGLPSVKKIVQAHGGTVVLANRTGSSGEVAGAMVIVSLPPAPADAVAAVEAEMAPTDGQGGLLASAGVRAAPALSDAGPMSGGSPA
jgi:signal transduction histidine kinase